MTQLDWSQCPIVESVPGRRSGAWVFKNTRMPVSTVFENLEAGSSIEEIIEQYDVTRVQIQAVLEFAARSLDTPPIPVGTGTADAHPDVVVVFEVDNRPRLQGSHCVEPFLFGGDCGYELIQRS